MNRVFPYLFFLSLIFLTSCQTKTNDKQAPDEEVSTFQKEHEGPLISKIAFGSCGSQDLPQPILNLAADQSPDLFIWLGDNIYGDSYEMDTIKNKYARLGAKAEFQRLKDSSQYLATWDDHDFGWNDSGRHYPFKKESKEIFLDFWEAAEDDIRHTRDGIYTSYTFEDQEHIVLVILLDTRTFRDDLRKYNGEPVDTTAFFYGLDYYPYETTDSTLLGAAQWAWLEEQFKQPADLRIIGSSTQFGITYNGYEAWANFPHEQQRMLDLIQSTKANGVVFISGDVHYAEISKLESPGLYPIYDVTASGITSTWHFAAPNDHRVDGPVMENHFGLIEIDWEAADPVVAMRVYDVENQLRFERKVTLSELKHPKEAG